MRVSRRALLMGAGAAVLGSATPLRRSFADAAIKEYRLAAKPAVVNLTGEGHPDTTVWAYDGTVPGTELRVRQGDPLRIVVSNNLDDGPLARHPFAEPDGWSAGPHPASNPSW